MRENNIVQPHHIEPAVPTIAYLWPNQFYQENPERAAHTPSHVSIESDETFDSGHIPRGSESLVSSDIPPEYLHLSHPPCFTLESALLVPQPILTQVPSNLLSVQGILQRICAGIDLDKAKSHLTKAE